MGACCTKIPNEEGSVEGGKGCEDSDVIARMRQQGAPQRISMYTQQGKKGINQDAVTVWEKFAGEEDLVFCGVFDGHGPHGHRVSSHVCDNLSSKLATAIKLSQQNSKRYMDLSKEMGNNDDSNFNSKNEGRAMTPFSLWEAGFVKGFKEMDEELSVDASIDSFCSGCTAVTVVKQGNQLIIANLGDSRAILCTRGNKNQLVPVQLTVDLKPTVPSEAERVRSCNGRIFALDEEPDVFRIWMPDEDCPGLAMARAFGDFCLKDYGLSSIPEVSYRKLTNDDEFVVLATDGIWDVLSNKEVVKIVASAKKRSLAAKTLVKNAVRAWRCRYPCSTIDDCTAVCLFLKPETSLNQTSISHATLSRQLSELSEVSENKTEVAEARSEVSHANPSEIAVVPGRSKEEDSAAEKLKRVKTFAKHPH